MHFFDARGKPVRTVGRKGAGPGEYRNANGLFVMPNGQVVISDPSNTRFTLLAANGDLVRTVPVQIRGFGYLWEPFLHEGKLVEVVNVLESSAGGREFYGPRLQVWATDFARSDTVPMASCQAAPSGAPASRVIDMRGEGGGTMTSVPFLSPSLPFARIRRGAETWNGNGATNVLLRHSSLNCDTLATIKLPGVRPPVTSKERAAAERMIRDMAARVKAPLPDLSVIPKERPWFETVRADDVGRAWVSRFLPNGSQRVEVFSPQGALVATIAGTLPFVVSRPALMTADRIIGFVQDEDEVMYLASWRIIR